MLDLCIQYEQPPVVQECVSEISISQNLYALSEMDLSFYNNLGAGFCSGNASSQTNKITG